MMPFRRLACAMHRLATAMLVPATSRPELWCRPATVLALRDPGRAGASLAGWR